MSSRTGRGAGGQVLDWTFELPAVGADTAGLEGYVVEDARGGYAGTVAAVLRRSDELFLAVDHSNVPVKHDLRVVRWDAVAGVDHDILTVRLALGPDELERAPLLDPGRKVEEDAASAARVTDVPARPLAAPPDPGHGPVDRTGGYLAPVALGLLGVFCVLVLAVWATGGDFGWWQFTLFAVPVILLAAAAVSAYRLVREPYVMSRPRRR